MDQSDSNQNLVVATFYTDAVEIPGKSRDEGRPIFEDKEMCKIQFVGDKDREYHFPANEVCKPADNRGPALTYATRYAKEYALFKAGEDQSVSGTPLTELAFLSKANVAELKGLNIKSAEALAALPANLSKRLGMQGNTWKMQAQTYLERAKGSSADAKLIAEIAKRDDEMATMRAQLDALLAGKPAEAVAEVAALTEPSPFDAFTDDDIKAWIKSVAPDEPLLGNFGHKTLVAKADKINKRLAEEAQRAKEAA
jgi:hypothetical protein